MINAATALEVVAITLEAVAMSNYARGSRHAYFAPHTDRH